MNVPTYNLIITIFFYIFFSKISVLDCQDVNQSSAIFLEKELAGTLVYCKTF